MSGQMLLQFLSLQKPLISTSSLLKRKTIISELSLDDVNRILKGRRRKSFLRAVEKESQFELDPDKAREALAKLDQQLQSLSQKQITPPKKRVSSSNLGPNAVSEPDRVRDLMREEMPEFSESYFVYSAFALLFFTFFYNIVFITIIQPSVDGREPAPVEAPDASGVLPPVPPAAPPVLTSQ